MPNKWRVVSLWLAVANLLTVWYLWRTQDRLRRAEDWLCNIESGQGLRAAEADFAAGKLRHFEIKTEPPPKIHQPMIRLTNEFLGRKVGPFAVWSWHQYDDGDQFSAKLRDEYVHTYNTRMTKLYEMKQPKRAQQP